MDVIQFCSPAAPALSGSSSAHETIAWMPKTSTRVSAGLIRALSAQAQSLGSHGFTVVIVDHPYEATVLGFPSRDVVYSFNSSDYNDELAQRLVHVSDFYAYVKLVGSASQKLGSTALRCAPGRKATFPD